ncbi:ribosomal-protein-alanine acetyltransferase [Archaeoglobus profundus DSM 5631]|uniref:Ribosomal-protein-alanine acetyltransferase n=1 Tax=Archaeoglobus profundus (strain DSM 5631 / JCM 9629 / NBRC 100127 / Av18) TaxID=572546 RepID=D2RGT9_ARCPA|nr:ribosomal-protein-alanine acetyltransferase [Archaeoglobus profundus DSM 5631]
MVIREYSVKDFRDIMEIDGEAFSPRNPVYDVYIYVTYGSDLLVADIGGKVVGYIAVMDIDRETSKIVSLAVKKEFRRKGIGTKLLSTAIERCKERGKKKIILEVRVSNYPAQNLYKKMGFKIVDVIPNYYQDGEDAYLMVLDLTQSTQEAPLS